MTALLLATRLSCGRITTRAAAVAKCRAARVLSAEPVRQRQHWQTGPKVKAVVSLALLGGHAMVLSTRRQSCCLSTTATPSQRNAAGLLQGCWQLLLLGHSACAPAAGEMVVMMAMCELPLRKGCSNRVSLESRYGKCFCRHQHRATSRRGQSARHCRTPPLVVLVHCYFTCSSA